MQEVIFKVNTVKEVAKIYIKMMYILRVYMYICIHLYTCVYVYILYVYMYSFTVFTLKMASCMCKPSM